MNARLARYLAQVYRRDILGESAVVEVPVPDQELVTEAKAEMARIDGLRLGANLVSRSFVDYQNRRALQVLLTKLEG